MTVIKLRRGLKKDLVNSNAEVGEPLLTTDTMELYVGKGEGFSPERIGDSSELIDFQVLEIEQQSFEETPNLIMKTNFLLNSLLDSKTKNMEQIVIDTLDDLTNVDTINSNTFYSELDKSFYAKNLNTTLFFKEVTMPSYRKRMLINQEGTGNYFFKYAVGSGEYKTINSGEIKYIVD